MTPMPLDTTAEPPEGEEDGAGLDAHAPLGLAVLLLERPQDGDWLYGTSEIITKTSLKEPWRSRDHFTITSHKITAAQFTKECEKIWLDTSVAEPGAADTSAQTASQLDETEKETKSEQTPANFAG